MISSGILISRRIFYYLFKSFNVIFQCVKYTSPVRDHICFCQETQSIAAHQTHTQSCQFSTHRVIDCRDGIGLANHVLSMYVRCAKEWCITNCARAVYHWLPRWDRTWKPCAFNVRKLCDREGVMYSVRNCAHAVIHGHTTQLRCVAVYYEMRVWLLAVPVFSCLEFSFLVVTGRNCYVFLCLGVNRISSL